MAKRSEVAALEARRFEAARWFARGESQAAVARANLCAPDRPGLVRPLHHGLRRVRARPHLAFSFLAHAGLSL
jgi:hypothetical protein